MSFPIRAHNAVSLAVLTPDALLDAVTAWRLSRDELRAWASERFDAVLARVDAALATASVVEEPCDGAVVLRPAAMSPEAWRAGAASRTESVAWYRRNVSLRGPFARGRHLADVARTMRGQNALGADLFHWLIPQRPVALGGCERVAIDDEVVEVPRLDATRVVADDGRVYEQFSGNDYLGLRVDPRVRAAAMLAARDLGVGSGGSRMLSGTSPEHAGLERDLAAWKGAEAAAVFNSGWHANVAAMTAFAGPGTLVFSDALNHASIIDGLRLSGATVRVFAHNSPDGLARAIDAALADPALGPAAVADALLVVEGVYSMDGDVARLAPMADLAERHGVAVYVDEAHSSLALGAGGHGVCEHAGVDPSRVALRMGTLSKAFGGEGGYVAGDARVIEALRLLGRPFWFSTALPASSAAAARAALRVAEAQPERRTRLARNAARLRDGLAALGYDLCGSETWIVPARVGDEARTALLQHRLREAGVLASAVFAPAVAPGQERVRLSISSEHEPTQIDRVIEVFRGFREWMG
ncbi:MAG: pyridoxal phosphate-dependent aminotransferase family protein [Polyangiales bacterium]